MPRLTAGRHPIGIGYKAAEVGSIDEPVQGGTRIREITTEIVEGGTEICIALTMLDRSQPVPDDPWTVQVAGNFSGVRGIREWRSVDFTSTPGEHIEPWEDGGGSGEVVIRWREWKRVVPGVDDMMTTNERYDVSIS